MRHSRRMIVASLVSSAWAAQSPAQFPDDRPNTHDPLPPIDQPGEDKKLPNGKSMNNAIAEREHTEVMKEAQQMVDLATQIKEELDKAGKFVVPVTTIRKTEDIEKLARKIRGRLKN